MKNKEYQLANFIFSEFDIGIPVKLLYYLQSSNIFLSLNSFSTYNELKNIDDYYLKELFSKFVKSKYGYLKYWNTFGYLKLNTS
jgi:hypothetical protein